MKKQNKRKNIRFKATWSHNSSTQRLKEMKPEELVVYIHRAEKEVIPLIEEMKASPTVAQFLLAQYTYIFVIGSNQLSTESAMNIANTVLLLWKDGLYIPCPEYPFTLEETLQEIEGGLKAKKDYSTYFQAFSPTKRDQPRCMGQVSGGIVKHPETNLWQIWAIVDGPCGYLGAYRDSTVAQRNLEEIVYVARKGATEAETKALYEKTLSRGDGQPKQIPFDMMEYLIEHIDSYQIEL